MGRFNFVNYAKKIDHDIFENIEYSHDSFASHKEIFRRLKNKKPYTITIIIETLNPKLWNKKEYVKKTKREVEPIYIGLLYESFFEEHGGREGNNLYAKWLEKYRSIWKKSGRYKTIDDYIINHELERRYERAIMKRYKNIARLKAPRVITERERYYRLPEPFSRVDWRNPYDNIFIWYDNNKKFALRGGSGSSGQRETNSKFILGLALINQKQPVPSYLFIYTRENKLNFVKRFRSLHVPGYDIGSNYFLSLGEREKTLQGVRLIEWKDFFKVEKIDYGNY